MSIAVFLPPQLLAHVRHVFASEPDFIVANSWDNLDIIIRRDPVTVVILDPSADGVMNTDAVAGLLNRYPSLPLVAYVMLSPKSFGAIAQLSRRGLEHVVLHRFDDSRERLQQTIARVKTNPPTKRFVAALAPSLRLVPLPLARAVHDMFDKPHIYGSVLDLAMVAGVPAISVYRHFDIARLASPKKMLVASRLLRGVTYLRDPGYSVREVALKLGYRHPRIFTAHVIEVFEMTPTRLRTRLTEDDAMASLMRWLDFQESPGAAAGRWAR
ncbi:MAG: AraC family transcriptional regulator [Gemmatimonadaceae bacterium]|nr:AraC family transcriptional regulator [Gemmatimonadaceae bacterium]